MHVWLDLISREILFTVVAAALGAGPASLLPERFDSTARAALSPVFGLALGVCVTVTLAYVFPAHATAWAVPVLAVVSLAVAARRRSFSWRHLDIGSVIQLAALVGVILVSFSYPLAGRHTVGPVGGYAIADTTGYVTETDGVSRESIHSATGAHPPYPDLIMRAWSIDARGTQQLDLAPLEASINALIGVGSTDTQTPFLIAVLLIGALGVFAVVRTVSPQPTWTAAFAGALFAGPLYGQLFMDGSQAAISGSALLAPIAILGREALRSPRLPTIALLALLAAALETVYPVFVPIVALGGGIVIVVLLGRALVRRSLTWPIVTRGARWIATLIGLAAVLSPVATARNLTLWKQLLTGSFPLAELPPYVLPFNELPGWALQSREFYNLIDLRHGATIGQLLLGAGVPLILLAVITLGVLRSRTAIVMLAIACAGVLVAYYTWANRNCGYCVQRNLIPAASVAIPAFGIGLAALAGLRPRAGPLLALLVAVGTIVVVGHEAIVTRQRLANGAYVLDRANRATLASLPSHSGRIEVEGFGQGPVPAMELPLVYDLAFERTDGAVSVPTTPDQRNGLQYLGGVEPLGPAFSPSYRYVLTRLAGILTSRRVIARDGPIALEQRVGPLDVTITGGVSVASARADPSGTAWVDPASGALTFLVAGGTGKQHPTIRLTLGHSVPLRVQDAPAGSSARAAPGTLRLCLPTAGSGSVRTSAVALSFEPQPAPPAVQRYAPPLPSRGVRLLRMTTSLLPCGRGPGV